MELSVQHHAAVVSRKLQELLYQLINLYGNIKIKVGKPK